MQLFTIGTVKLNLDGSQALDGNGNPIPTYNNEEQLLCVRFLLYSASRRRARRVCPPHVTFTSLRLTSPHPPASLQPPARPSPHAPPPSVFASGLKHKSLTCEVFGLFSLLR